MWRLEGEGEWAGGMEGGGGGGARKREVGWGGG